MHVAAALGHRAPDVGVLSSGRSLLTRGVLAEAQLSIELTLFGRPLAFVGPRFAFIGGLLAITGDAVPLVGDAIALVGDALPSGQLPLPPSQADFAIIHVVTDHTPIKRRIGLGARSSVGDRAATELSKSRVAPRFPALLFADDRGRQGA